MIKGAATSLFQQIPSTFRYTKEESLKSRGWVKDSLGQYRSSGQIKEKEDFLLYTRRRNMRDFIDDFSKKSSNKAPENPSKIKDFQAGSSLTMGFQERELTPIDNKGFLLSGAPLPILSSFSDYSSLRSIRKDNPCLLIGFDAEWQNLETDRDIISWQCALVDGNDLFEFVFLKNGTRNISFMDILGCILDHLDSFDAVDVRHIRRYRYCSGWDGGHPVEVITSDLDEARSRCKYVYRDNLNSFTKERIQDMPDRYLRRSERDWAWFHAYLDYNSVKNIKVCVVCHTGIVDLTSLSDSRINILRYLTSVQGGVVSLQPVRIAPKSMKNVNNSHVYPVCLSIADTMCHAPAGKKKLRDLGEVLGIEKINIGEEQKANMRSLLFGDPVLFLEYASMDSVIAVLYASALYGYNNIPPVTITSAAAEGMKEHMMFYMDCKSTEEFDRVYRGLEKVKHGKFKIPDRPGYVEATNLEPVSNDANTVQYFASQGYHGGYNTCTEVGYFPFDTYDYDLKNAYPTAMCLVPDINWENPIRSEVIRRDLTLADFAGIGGINPIAPFVGYIRFEFPDKIKYPCIPVNVDGIPVYPLTSEGLDGVYVAGPFVWLALRLGAHVYCDRGYFLNVLYTKDYASESRSLAVAVKQLVKDRNLAKQEKGKGSLEELIIKVMVNSGYGKVAQNVIQKTSWTALKDLMEDIGCSAVTNPVSAMMITSIVQIELIAAQNQIHDLGYMSCSVTTDGFISNCPEHVLQDLDLFGLRRYIEAARIYLANNPELWEIKHRQDDLINFTTRGNVSLRCNERDGYDGVCAHNSCKSGFEADSYEDRLWLMIRVLERTGTVDYTDEEWPSFKELVQGKPFVTKKVTRHIHMDFDMKRKPLRSSFKTDQVLVNGVNYEVAHFETIPFSNIAEYRLYRRKKSLVDVLKTEADWNIFFEKIDFGTTKAQPRDLEWSILNSCIMGYRKGCWDIPGLTGKTVSEKCDWINTHNTSGKKFTVSDWKNARRPERQANMLPYEMIEEKLNELKENVF